MKTYTVPTRLVFKGEFEVKADSPAAARDIVQNHCGLVLGGAIHSTADASWSFDVHAAKIISQPKPTRTS